MRLASPCPHLMGATYAEKNAHFKCKFAFAAMHQNIPMTNRTVVNFARQLRESGRSRSFVPTPKSGAAWGPAGLIAALARAEHVVVNSSSEIPVFVGGSGITIDIPADKTRCVRVRFSAVAECPLSCFLRAVADTNELNPSWTSNALRFSSGDEGTAHSFEWVERLGAGEHTIKISTQTGNSSVVAKIGPWTHTVEVLE